MTTYEQILKQSKEQNIDFKDKHIIIPLSDNIFTIDGNRHFGRLFEDEQIIYLVYDTEDEYEGHKELVLYRIVDKYHTWIKGDTISYYVEFYIVE